MRIIKVVHDGESAAEQHGISNRLRDFDVAKFIEGNYDTILKLAECREKNEALLRLKEEPKFKQRDAYISFLKTAGVAIAENLANGLAGAKSYSHDSCSHEIEILKRDLEQLKRQRRSIAFATASHMHFLLESPVPNVEHISLSAAKEKYYKTQNLAVGSYTLHPRDSKILTRLSNFHMNLALERDDELVMLLGRMGARKVEILEFENSGKDFLATGNVRTIVTDSGSSLELKSATDQGQQLNAIFEGTQTNIPDDLLSSSIWFSDDSRLLSIFESRRFSHNKIVKYSITSTYSETFDFDFKLAAKLVSIKADLEAEYNSVSKKTRLFNVEFGSAK